MVRDFFSINPVFSGILLTMCCIIIFVKYKESYFPSRCMFLLICLTKCIIQAGYEVQNRMNG